MQSKKWTEIEETADAYWFRNDATGQVVSVPK